jgi:predicted ATPase
MRLALSGPSGTGKTTLAIALAERLRLPLCPVGARSVAADMGFSSPYDVDKAGLRKEFMRVLTQQKGAWEAAHDSFVTDRTHYDNLAYTLMENPLDIDRSILETVKLAGSRYDHLVVCPLSVFQKLGTDVSRRHDAEYHAKYQSVLWSLIERLCQARRLTLQTDALAERIEAVTSFVGLP